MIVSEEYYKTKYLLGRAPVIPDGRFAFWERSAAIEIDFRRSLNTLDESAGQSLKNCICEVAEFLYSLEQAQSAGQHGAGDGPNGLVSGFTNDGYAVQYIDVNKPLREITRADTAKTIRGIAIKWLSGTEYHNSFAFRGC